MASADGLLSFSTASTVGFLYIVGSWIFSLAHNDGGIVDAVLAAAWSASSLLLSSLFANPLWRLLCVSASVGASLALPFSSASPSAAVLFSLAVLIARAPHLLAGEPQPARGIVFVTGADSGMGYHSAIRLARAGYHVVAGCYAKDSGDKLRAELAEDGDDNDDGAAGRLTAVPLNVTDDRSVSEAADAVKSHPQYESLGLVGLIQCAGVGYNGPSEYFPLAMYKDQMEVNFFGYVRVLQSLMPHLRESASRPGARRGRVAFFGTGGGPCSPLPPLLSAYMSSKFAAEAFCGSLRVEMQLTERPIDCCMVNPGFVKPTNLMAGGMELTRRMWKTCEELRGDDRAEREYGELLETFVKYSEDQPGTHVSEVARTVEELMAAPRPLSSYKVGPDSKAAPFAGMLPTGVREFVVKMSMYGRTGAV